MIVPLNRVNFKKFFGFTYRKVCSCENFFVHLVGVTTKCRISKCGGIFLFIAP